MAHAEQHPLQPFLDRLNSRSILSPAEQQMILSLPTRAVQIEKNRDYVGLGEKTDHACYVVAGLMGRFDQNARGERQITALHIRGDMPDLHSVVQPKATSALQALTTSTILRIPHSAIRQMAGNQPAIGEALWRDTMVDSMILAQWVVNLGRRNAKTRLAHVFCEMACRYGGQPDGGLVICSLPMSQTQLADAAGLTAVHVNRSLMALKEEGTTLKGGTLRIADWTRLATLGDFNPDYLQIDVRPDERIRIVE